MVFVLEGELLGTSTYCRDVVPVHTKPWCGHTLGRLHRAAVWQCRICLVGIIYLR